MFSELYIWEFHERKFDKSVSGSALERKQAARRILLIPLMEFPRHHASQPHHPG